MSPMFVCSTTLGAGAAAAAGAASGLAAGGVGVWANAAPASTRAARKENGFSMGRLRCGVEKNRPQRIRRRPTLATGGAILRGFRVQRALCQEPMIRLTFPLLFCVALLCG